MSLANTTSAVQVLVKYKPKVAGDCVPDATIEELERRGDFELDLSALNDQGETTSQGTRQASNQSLAIGATELIFSWTEPFANTLYSFQLYATSDPGAPFRCWVKSKTTTNIKFGIVGATAATNFAFIANP